MVHFQKDSKNSFGYTLVSPQIERVTHLRLEQREERRHATIAIGCKPRCANTGETMCHAAKIPDF